MGYVLYVHNKFGSGKRKGKPKGYGQWHPSKASAERHRKNQRDTYKDNPKDLMGTRIVKVKANHSRLSSKQIRKKSLESE